VKPRIPGLRLLFSAEEIADDAPLYVLTEGLHHLGRELGSLRGICLTGDRRASRVHAAVSVGRSATPIQITDQDSKNGVFVNGVRCQQAALRDGDVVRIGESLLLLRYEPPDVPDAPLATLLGVSAAQRTLRARIQSIASLDYLVLLLGESGTAKDLSARALHAASGRAGPLICVNCGAIPDTLAESQFFGHVAGSFTGAQHSRPGLFTAAHRGTLFLDEIGELSARSQALLLRVLEDRAVTPVGATAPIPCDARIVAATNRDLRASVDKGVFRGDLYARLSSIILPMVPLRSRREDLLLLLRHAMGSPMPAMTARLAEALLLYSYPFNIRELNQLAHNLRASGEDLLDLPLIAERLTIPLPAESPSDDGSQDAVSLPKQPLPKEVLLRLMEEHHGIIARVAQAAGRSRRQVLRWLAQNQIDAAKFRH
jgi:transcriptional regulator with PAS, ATPase and Fis domain